MQLLNTLHAGSTQCTHLSPPSPSVCVCPLLSFGGSGYGAPRSYGGGGGFSRSAGPCYEFRESGSCKFGDNCRFSHSSGADVARSGSAGICYQFKNAGNCTYGSNCRFSHDLSSEKKDDLHMDGQPQEAQ